MILYSGDNAANQTAPDSARTDVFNAVARVTNNTGSVSGSAVHIRGKYMLTANHVSLGPHVTFDGVTTWARDTSFAPVVIGTTDMKLFKLVEDPGLPETLLHTTLDGTDYTSGSGRNKVTVIGTLVGWGRGRNPADSQTGTNRLWNWSSSNSTCAKRWGTNEIEETYPVENVVDYNYTYTALRTHLGVSAGNNEAAAVLYDSGSGIFIESGGVWRLAGITTLVSTDGSSNFSLLTPDINYFVRVSSYASDIEAAIPDPTTFSGWKIDHGLYGTAALDTADDDGDGIPLLMEFALGGDPSVPDAGILPVPSIDDSGSDKYLELSLTRPVGLQHLNYLPQTTTDLASWPVDSSGIVDASPTPVDHGDGTETLTFRRAAPLGSDLYAFMRLVVSEVSP